MSNFRIFVFILSTLCTVSILGSDTGSECIALIKRELSLLDDAAKFERSFGKRSDTAWHTILAVCGGNFSSFSKPLLSEYDVKRVIYSDGSDVNLSLNDICVIKDVLIDYRDRCESLRDGYSKRLSVKLANLFLGNGRLDKKSFFLGACLCFTYIKGLGLVGESFRAGSRAVNKCLGLEADSIVNDDFAKSIFKFTACSVVFACDCVLICKLIPIGIDYRSLVKTIGVLDRLIVLCDEQAARFGVKTC